MEFYPSAVAQGVSVKDQRRVATAPPSC